MNELYASLNEDGAGLEIVAFPCNQFVRRGAGEGEERRRTPPPPPPPPPRIPQGGQEPGGPDDIAKKLVREWGR